MSVGPMGGVVGSAAGAPLSQTKGSETERAARESAAQSTERDAASKSEKAVGQTQEDQGASDRDADGRRLWEAPEQATAGNDEDRPETPPLKSRDASGSSGGQLDLMG